MYQNRLFDPFDPVLTEKTRKRLLDDWPGVFRHVILELMPVNILSEHYNPDLGRPTKELYSMAGLIFMMEFFNWKKPEALNAYSFHMDVHFALNMEPVTHDLGIRTLERYIVLFEEDDLAKKIFHDVTTTLAELLELKVDKQRLDSTHIFSDMASFGRTRLMGVAIKRFLTQVLRHHPSAYEALPEVLRQRYRPSVHQMFGDTGKDKQSRRLLRQQVAEDIYFLIGHFADMAPLNNGTCFKAMKRIFYEQCEVHEDKVTVVAGWNVLRSSVCAKIREIVYQRANVAVWRAYCLTLFHMFGRKTPPHGSLFRFVALCGDRGRLFRIHAAA